MSYGASIIKVRELIGHASLMPHLEANEYEKTARELRQAIDHLQDATIVLLDLEITKLTKQTEALKALKQ